MTARANPRPFLLVVSLTVALVALCVLSLGLGAVDIPPDQVVRTLLGHPPNRLVDNIVWTVRVPRTVLAATAGAALGLSGALMQALTRNPLADPGILGVSAGASFGIVVAVAQGTPVLLLDEPTTYLDLAHQIDVLDLVTDLNRRERRTVVMVLHDLNQACRYADHVIAMKAGRIAAEGPPAEVITTETVEDVFGLRCQVATDPVSGTPLVIPMSRHHEPVPAAAE